MPAPNFKNRTLWAGDNLDVMRGYAYGATYLLALVALYGRAQARLRAGKGGRLVGLLHPTLRGRG